VNTVLCVRSHLFTPKSETQTNKLLLRRLHTDNPMRIAMTDLNYKSEGVMWEQNHVFANTPLRKCFFMKDCFGV